MVGWATVLVLATLVGVGTFATNVSTIFTERIARRAIAKMVLAMEASQGPAIAPVILPGSETPATNVRRGITAPIALLAVVRKEPATKGLAEPANAPVMRGGKEPSATGARLAFLVLTVSLAIVERVPAAMVLLGRVTVIVRVILPGPIAMSVLTVGAVTRATCALRIGNLRMVSAMSVRQEIMGRLVPSVFALMELVTMG